MPAFGPRIGLGARATGVGVGAPTIAVVTPIANPPSFTIGLPANAKVGDVLNLAIYSSSSYSVIVAGPYTHTLDSGDLAGGSISLFNGTLTPGTTYYSAAWLTRSGTDGPRGFGGAFTPSSLLSGLLNYWKFDEGSGNTAADSVGGLTATGANSPTWTSGIIGSAWQFNGTNQSASTSTSGPPTGTGALSVAAWFKSSAGAGQHTMVSIGNHVGDVAGGGLNLSLEAGVVWARCNLSNTASGGSGFSDNAWHLAVIRKAAGASPSGLQINVDGVDKTPTTAGSATIDLQSGNAVCFGANVGNASPAPFPGIVDAVGIWNRVITSGEIAALYNAGAGAEYPF